jgi:predicted phosphate transport protein (TIGR00153 family)
MRTIAKLFGRSPFSPLQTHMSKVADCVQKVPELFMALQEGDYEGIEKLSEEISELEHAADLAKNDIRNNLPKGLFLPVDKATLLSILAIQDSIADVSQDIGDVLVLRNLKMREVYQDELQAFLDKNIESFIVAQKIIQEMDELLESSFGGLEAEKVTKMVDEVAYKEHEADLLQQKLLKKLFNLETEIPYPNFVLWLRLVETLGSISDLSENLGNRVRMMLEVK